MYIKFESLKLNNFLSFGTSEVNLNGQGYVSVVGINEYNLDCAKSNGSGKSSIWESIIWCLTGNTIRGTKDVVNKLNGSDTFVELKFKIDADNYIIIRYKDHSKFGNNLKIIKNGNDISGKGIRDSEKILEQHLPDLTESLIGSVIILGQGLPQRFTNNTPSGRKEILEKLSKSDFMIEDIKVKLSNRKAQLNTDLRKLEDAILELDSKKSVYESELDKSIVELTNLLNEPVIDYDNELVKIDLDISYNESNLDTLENNIIKANDILQDNRLKYTNLDNELKSKQLDISTKYDRNELVKERYAVGSQISQLEKSINDANNVKDVCPTCGQKLPDVHKIDTTNLERELDSLRIQDNELCLKINLSKENENKEINELQESYKQLKDTLLKEGQQSRLNYDNLVKDKNIIIKTISELKLNKQSLINKRDNYLSNKVKLEEHIDIIKNNIKAISEKNLYNTIDKDNIKSRIDVVNKMLTIATRDFRGFLLSEIINFIDKKAKEYCKDIFGTTEIEFKLDGNNIFIGYCGKQYENLSGGEKQKIDIIVQFSIRDMLSTFLNFSSNILVLDEIFDNLDLLGCQNLLNLISNKLLDIDSIFIITHHTDIDIPCDKELVVIKNKNGISEIN